MTRPVLQSTNESDIQREIFAAMNGRVDCRVFRNNVGVGFQGSVVSERDGILVLKNYRRVRFGLKEGSSDLIGWTVKNGVAVFTSLEVKNPKGEVTPEQFLWLHKVIEDGGLAGVVRSVDEAKRVINATD